ncbi:MAG TPA: hypothetical protein VLE43_01010 [Candidatus Saccharimonadia bacterium]|nr:hypothetical protein [Candidatus Saccharimonadia bacterium]
MPLLPPRISPRAVSFTLAATLAMAVPLMAEPAAATSPAAIPAASKAEFDKVMQPFLSEHCDRCHNEKKQKGEFRVDNLSCDLGGGHSANKWAEVMDRSIVELQNVPAGPGNSGFRIKFKPILLLEGFRPARIVRLWSAKWKVDDLPREERIYQ